MKKIYWIIIGILIVVVSLSYSISQLPEYGLVAHLFYGQDHIHKSWTSGTSFNEEFPIFLSLMGIWIGGYLIFLK